MNVCISIDAVDLFIMGGLLLLLGTLIGLLFLGNFVKNVLSDYYPTIVKRGETQRSKEGKNNKLTQILLGTLLLSVLVIGVAIVVILIV